MHIMFTQKQLEIFRAVMQTGSVSAAGRRMNLSQPSVSRILGDLERQFGVPLFQRQSKGVRPTPEAEAFLEEVERNYLVLTNLEEAAAQIARKERGTLSIATITAASLEIVPRALERMQVQEKQIKVSWQVKSSKWVLDLPAPARSGLDSPMSCTCHPGCRFCTKTPFRICALFPRGTRCQTEKDRCRCAACVLIR